MGRCTVTRGQRGLGRKIRKLEDSVELSSNETKAKVAEIKYKQKAKSAMEIIDDSPVKAFAILLITKETNPNSYFRN
jgi:hypothetical protein